MKINCKKYIQCLKGGREGVRGSNVREQGWARGRGPGEYRKKKEGVCGGWKGEWKMFWNRLTREVREGEGRRKRHLYLTIFSNSCHLYYVHQPFNSVHSCNVFVNLLFPLIAGFVLLILLFINVFIDTPLSMPSVYSCNLLLLSASTCFTLFPDHTH